MSGIPALWAVVSATARGSTHVAKDLPNQDAHAQITLADGTVVVAVADGHGGRGYVRSGVGSRLAVDCALDVVAGALLEAGTGWTALGDFPARLVAAWRSAVLADLSGNPLSDKERGLATAETLAQPMQLYGSTLLVAALGRDGLWAAQIGDGDIVVASGGSCRTAVPGDDRLVGNATTSLCGPSATADFRTGVLRQLAPGDLVLLASDGYGNSFASDDWAPEVLGDLAEAIDHHGIDQVGNELPSWVSQSAAVGGDDTTVVLVSRRGVAAEPNDELVGMRTVVRGSDEDEIADASAPRLSPADPHDPSPRRKPTRVGKVRAAAYVVGFVVLLAGAVGVALRFFGAGEAELTTTAGSSASRSPARTTSRDLAEDPLLSSRPCPLPVPPQGPWATPPVENSTGSWSVKCVPDESLDVYWYDPITSYWSGKPVEWRKGQAFIGGRKVPPSDEQMSSIWGTTGL